MRIGIITMQSIYNYGSALQSYALQTFLEKELKCEAELINYKYPNSFQKKQVHRSLYQKIRDLISDILFIVLPTRVRKRKRFEEFWKLFFHLSREYESKDAIFSNPPIYDIYMTGSDQTWNLNGTKCDPTFFCGFAPVNSRKVAFSASFAHDKLPKGSEQFVKDNLKGYTHIGCREYSSLTLLESLKMENVELLNTCDPSLLLSCEDYNKLELHSKISLPQRYILVYYMGYAFPPQPAFNRILQLVEEHYQLPVMYLGGVSRHDSNKNHFHIDGIGPCEFLSLVKNATYVLTSSFHGTMFAIIYRKPFTSIIAPKWHSDHRLSDLSKSIGMECNFIAGDDNNKIPSFSDPFTKENLELLNDYIFKSKEFLSRSINQ